jgi:hypothetical protein
MHNTGAGPPQLEFINMHVQDVKRSILQEYICLTRSKMTPFKRGKPMKVDGGLANLSEKSYESIVFCKL